MINPKFCTTCGCSVAQNSEPVTVEGWYGGHHYAWINGHPTLIEVACDIHNDRDFRAARENAAEADREGDLDLNLKGRREIPFDDGTGHDFGLSSLVEHGQ